MFIKQVKKQRSRDSKVFYQYTLAQTSRIDGKVKQTNLLYLGSDKLLENKGNRQIVLELLKSRIFGQQELFKGSAPRDLQKLADQYHEKYRIKYGDDNPNPTTLPPSKDRAEYHKVDIKGLDVGDCREFGAEHLCRQVLDKLGLKAFLTGLGISGPGADKALIGIAAKAIYSSSEHKTAQVLNLNSGLAACFNYNKPITHKGLYAVSDMLYKFKPQIDKYLYNRVTDLFDIRDNLVIFDISNTYFETGKPHSQKAEHGRSKEKRDDCPLAVFTGVINKEGFIRHSRIYEGNKADIATLGDMVSDLQTHAPGSTEHTIVMDAGIAGDKNLKMLDGKGYKYVCVSRTRLKDYKLADGAGKQIQLTNRKKEKVELQLFCPNGYKDTWMYVESEGKRKKEQSINVKLRQRYEEELQNIKNSFSKKGGTKKINKVWERIGRAKQKHKWVSARYKIEVDEQDGKATGMQWAFIENRAKEDKSKGVYFIRTNLQTTNESALWDIYNTIREVEATFRSLKTDLNIRPVYHQNDERVEAHLYLTMLAYQLVNTVRHMLKKQNINYDWKNIVRIMSTQKIQTVQIPTDKKTIHIRKPSKPIYEVQQIYKATNCNETQKTVKKYVVYH